MKAGRFISLFLLSGFIWLTTPAVFAESGVPFSNEIDISTLDISSTSSETLNLDFSLASRSPFERTVLYTVFFQPRNESSSSYTYVVRETVSLKPEAPVPVSVTLPAPNFLLGEYELFVRVETPSGAFLAQGHAALVELSNTATLEIVRCKTVADEGVSIGKTLKVDEGVAFPEVYCDIRSTSVDPRSRDFYLVANVTDYQLSGALVASDRALVTLAGGQTKSVVLSSLGKHPAGPYILEIIPRDAMLKTLGAPYTVPVLVSGNAAKVLSSTPDMTAYSAHETALVTLDARFYGSNREDFTIITTFEDAGGVCGTSAAVKWRVGDPTILEVPMEKDCLEYTLTTTVQIGERVLDTLREEFHIVRQHSEKSLSTQSSFFRGYGKIALALIVCLSIIGLGWYLVRAKRSQKRNYMSTLCILGFGIMAFFGSVPSVVQAGNTAGFVWTWSPTCPVGGATETRLPEGDGFGRLTFDKGTYSPGETVNVTATANGSMTPALGVNDAAYWFSYSVPGAWGGDSYSFVSVPGGSLNFSRTYSFSAPSTPGTYTSTGSFLWRPLGNPPDGTNCRWSMFSNAWSGETFTVSQPYNLCGLAPSPGFGCDTPFPVGENFSTLSACQSALSGLLSGRLNNCTPPLTCQIGACSVVVPPTPKPTVTLNGSIAQLNASPLKNIAELIIPPAIAGGSGSVSCNQGLDLNWTSTNATSCTASTNCPATGFNQFFGSSGSYSVGYATLLACSRPITFSMRCTGPGGVSNTDTYTVDSVGSCSTTTPVDGVCNNNQSGGCISPSSLWSTGVVTQIYNIKQWKCDGTGGGAQSPLCEYIACGSDDGQTLGAVPINLCASGIPSAVSGNGPWSWTCTGSIDSGIVKSCSANRSISGSVCGNNIQESGEACDDGDINHGNGNGVCPKLCSTGCTYNSCASTGGTCGTAARNYANSESSYSGTFCEGSDTPNPDPLMIGFPSEGGTKSWMCGSATCVASRDLPSGGYPAVSAVLRVDSGNPGYPATAVVQYSGLTATHRTATLSVGQSTVLVAQINGGTYPRAWIFKSPTQFPPLPPTPSQLQNGAYFGYSYYGNGTPIEGTPSATIGWGTDISISSAWTPGPFGSKVHEFDTGILTTDTTYRVMSYDLYSHTWYSADLTLIVGVAPVPSLIVCPDPPVPVTKGSSTTLSAYYSLSGVQSCTGTHGTLVTGGADWSAPGVFVSVGNGAFDKGVVHGLSAGTESVTASYSGLSANTSVTVIEPLCSTECDANSAEAQNTCGGTTYTIWNACRGLNETCPGSRSCDFNWKEVAP